MYISVDWWINICSFGIFVHQYGVLSLQRPKTSPGVPWYELDFPARAIMNWLRPLSDTIGVSRKMNLRAGALTGMSPYACIDKANKKYPCLSNRLQHLLFVKGGLSDVVEPRSKVRGMNLNVSNQMICPAPSVSFSAAGCSFLLWRRKAVLF